MYQMANFAQTHLVSASIAVVISIALFAFSFFFDKRKYGVFLGAFLIVSKLFDIYLRVVWESYPDVDSLPFNMCNIAILLAGAYLITGRRSLFSIVSCRLFAPIVVVFVPSSFPFDYYTYSVVFFLTHILIVVAALYGYMFYGDRVDRKGLLLSIGVFFVAVLNAFIWNALLGTNFFYVNDYVLPFLSGMGISLYRIFYIGFNLLSMVGVYCLIYRKK